MIHDQRMARATMFLALALGASPDVFAGVPVDVDFFAEVENLRWDSKSDTSTKINTEHGEWAPTLSTDGLTLYFVSDRPSGGPMDIYEATRVDTDELFRNPRRLDWPINTDSHEWLGSVLADGTLFFSSDRPGGYGDYDIYQATRRGGSWNVECLEPPINTASLDGGPHVTPDGLEMFFNSKRTGGYGGYDIYRASRAARDEPFGNLELLCSPVNSPYNEAYPSLSDDGLTLFFNDAPWDEPLRPGGWGGRDLWMATRRTRDEPFGNVINLGPAINSTGIPGESTSDVSAGWPAVGATLYFASRGSHGGHGGVDLFQATLISTPPVASFAVTPEIGAAPLRVDVDGGASTTDGKHAIVSYEWDFGDGQTAGGEPQDHAAGHTYDECGRFPVCLTIADDRNLTVTTCRSVRVRCPSGHVAPWTAVDVGEPLFPGSSRLEGGCLSMCAGGTGIGGTSDEFHFAYRELDGDAAITAEVVDLTVGPGGAVGVMFRESLDSKARYAAALFEKNLTGRTRYTFRWRSERAGWQWGAWAELPARVWLERRGNEFIGYSSADGEIHRVTLNLPARMVGGIAAVGGDSNRCSFEPLEARVCIVPGVTFQRGDANAGRDIDLSDAAFILNYLFTGGPPPSCLKSADCDDNGVLEITDPVRLLSHLFSGGPPPASPFPDCGPDPTSDDLTCESFDSCQVW